MAGRKAQRALAAPRPLRLNLNAEVPTPFVLPWSWYIKQHLYWQLPKLLSVTVTADGLRDGARYAAMVHEDREFGLRVTFNQTTALDRYAGYHLGSIQKINQMELHFTLSRRTCPCTIRAQQNRTCGCGCGSCGCGCAAAAAAAATSGKGEDAATSVRSFHPTAVPACPPLGAGRAKPTARTPAPAPALCPATRPTAQPPGLCAVTQHGLQHRSGDTGAPGHGVAAADRPGGSRSLATSTSAAGGAAPQSSQPQPAAAAVNAHTTGSVSSFEAVALAGGQVLTGRPTSVQDRRLESGGGSGTTTSTPSNTAMNALDFSLVPRALHEGDGGRRGKGVEAAEDDEGQDGDSGDSDGGSEGSEGPLAAALRNPFLPDYCSCPCHLWRRYWPDPDKPHASPLRDSLPSNGWEQSDSDDVRGRSGNGEEEEEDWGGTATGAAVQPGPNRRRGGPGGVGRGGTKRRRRAVSPEGQDAAAAAVGPPARRQRVGAAERRPRATAVSTAAQRPPLPSHAVAAGCPARSSGGEPAAVLPPPPVTHYVRARPCLVRPGSGGCDGAAGAGLPATSPSSTACAAQLPPLSRPPQGRHGTSTPGGGPLAAALPQQPSQPQLQQPPQQHDPQHRPPPPYDDSISSPRGPQPAQHTAPTPLQPRPAAAASSPRSATLAVCRSLGITLFHFAHDPAGPAGASASVGTTDAAAPASGRALLGPLLALPQSLVSSGGPWRPDKRLTLRVLRGSELLPAAFSCAVHQQGQALCAVVPEHLRGLSLVGAGRVGGKGGVVVLAVAPADTPQAAMMVAGVSPRVGGAAQDESQPVSAVAAAGGGMLGPSGTVGAAAGQQSGSPHSAAAPAGVQQRDVRRDAAAARITAIAAARARGGGQSAIALGGRGGDGTGAAAQAPAQSQGTRGEAAGQAQQQAQPLSSPPLPAAPPRPACVITKLRIKLRGSCAAGRLVPGPSAAECGPGTRASALEAKPLLARRPPPSSAPAAAAAGAATAGNSGQEVHTSDVPARAEGRTVAAELDSGNGLGARPSAVGAGPGVVIKPPSAELPLDVLEHYYEMCGCMPRLLCLQVDEEVLPEEYVISVTDSSGAPIGPEACLPLPPGASVAAAAAQRAAGPGGQQPHVVKHQRQDRGQDQAQGQQQRSHRQAPGRPSSLLVQGIPNACLGLLCAGWGVLDRAPYPLVLCAKKPAHGGAPQCAAATATAAGTMQLRQLTAAVAAAPLQDDDQRQVWRPQSVAACGRADSRSEAADEKQQQHQQQQQHRKQPPPQQQQQQQMSRKRSAQQLNALQRQQLLQPWPPAMLAPDGRPVCRAAWDVTPLELPDAHSYIRPGAVVQGNILRLAPVLFREHVRGEARRLRLFVERDGYVDVPTAAWVVALVFEDGVPVFSPIPPHALGCYFLGWGRLPGGSLVLRVSTTREPGPAAETAAAAAAAALQAERLRLERAKRLHSAVSPSMSAQAGAGQGPEGPRLERRFRREVPYETFVRSAPRLPKSAVAAPRGCVGGNGGRRSGSRAPAPPSAAAAVMDAAAVQ